MTDDEQPPGSSPPSPPRRRRRPQAPPVEQVAATVVPRADQAQPAARSAGRAQRWPRWRRELLPSIGLSPTFRAYLFAGSILAALGFLLYNESMMRQLRDQEKSNVDLYAKLISLAPLADDEQSVAIFQEISIKRSISFPIIVTDYTGRVTQYNNLDIDPRQRAGKATGLLSRLAFWQREAAPTAPPPDPHAALAPILAAMDAQNEPIAFYSVPHVVGHVYAVAGNLVIADGRDWPVQWQGPDLPEPADTSQAARARVEHFLSHLPAGTAPLVFQSAAGSPGYLFFDGTNLVVADQKNRVVAWQGPDLPAASDSSSTAPATVAARLLEIGGRAPPVTFQIPAHSYIHYGESRLVQRMSRATYVQILALLLFLLVSYVGFRNIQRSEQRSIWVGMAKETAHQLGTPLSSLSGWVELLEAKLKELQANAVAPAAAVDELRQMVAEMAHDMQRLAQIASRFSQIGSVPELRRAELVPILDATVAYFRARGPQFGQHQIDLQVHGTIPPMPLNADLIGWVFENLFKNSIDALEGGRGTIRIDVRLDDAAPAVRVAFSDSGRGIAPEHLSRVFAPGFSTKKRGWGLGLAFAKRIVEEYHGGHITVLRSAPGQGTTFELLLPLPRS